MDKITKPVKFDEVGTWSELKLEILTKYAKAYTTILRQNRLHPIYIDGFAGAGQHISRSTKDLIPGSPLNALTIEPSFDQFYLVDLKHVFCMHLLLILRSDPQKGQSLKTGHNYAYQRNLIRQCGLSTVRLWL